VIDTHAHLGDDAGEVLERARTAGVHRVIEVATSVEGARATLDRAERNDDVYACLGVHPHEAGKPADLNELRRLLDHPKAVAVGETGLDYYRLEGDLGWQRERFRVHIRAALRARMPLVIHTRAASADTIALMQEENARDAGGVMHCFTETWDVARAALDLGFHISLSGIVTFKNAHDVKDVARRVPLDRLLIETDAPYLAPVPFRGKRNQPAYVPHVAAEIAQLRGVPAEDIARATTENFFRLFRIDAKGGSRVH